MPASYHHNREKAPRQRFPNPSYDSDDESSDEEDTYSKGKSRAAKCGDSTTPWVIIGVLVVVLMLAIYYKGYVRQLICDNKTPAMQDGVLPDGGGPQPGGGPAQGLL